MKKVVNGVLMDMTPDEIAKWNAEQAEYEAGEPQRRREAMTVTNKDLRLALNDRGVYGDIEGVMAKSTNTTELEIHWNHSTNINRLDPWVVEVGTGLGMNDDQLDELFEAAMELANG